MSPDNTNIDALRQALSVSPDNIHLRRLLAETLLATEDFEEAETEFKRALRLDRGDADVLQGLARVYHAQGKHGAALVVLEELLEGNQAPASAHALYARVLLGSGKPREAAQAYRKAVEMDPGARDEEMAERLGVDANPRDSEVVDGRRRASMGDAADDRAVDILEKPKMDFNGVGGMEKVKEEIRMKIILPLTNKDLYASYGKSIGGGILMYGPPGCGKTHLARATAGEIRSDFMSVGLHDVLDMWIGQSEQKLHQIFQQARSHAPCVLFFDEVDALGASRSDMRSSGGRHLINQFLAELDGIDSSNEGVLILAATNAPWHLDGAFRRPGRFDRILFIPPPDAAARAAVFEIQLEGKPAENVDVEKIAKKTEGYSGADIKAAVELAVEDAMKEALKKGVLVPITTKRLLTAVKNLRPSTAEWFGTARNHALYSNESGIYNDILDYMKITKT